MSDYQPADKIVAKMLADSANTETTALRAEVARLREALDRLEKTARNEGLEDQADAIAAMLGDTP